MDDGGGAASGRLAVRVAGVDDVEAIRRLVLEADAPWVPRIGVEPAPMSADYATVVADGHGWVVEDRGRLLGLIVLVPEVDHLLIENVAVAPDAQGRGVGGVLMDQAERRAGELGLPQLRLYTNVLMTENIAYYERRGYRETSRETEGRFHRAFFVKDL